MARSLARAVKELAREPVQDRDSSYKGGHELQRSKNDSEKQSYRRDVERNWRSGSGSKVVKDGSA
jgi:hypothetical protein